MQTLGFDSMTLNFWGELRGWAYLRDRSGVEVIVVRSMLVQAALDASEDVAITAPLHKDGVRFDTVTTSESWDTIKPGEWALGTVTVHRRDVQRALVCSMASEVVGVAQIAMDIGAGDYRWTMERLEGALAALRDVAHTNTGFKS
ncbi:hypothetical protein [Ottowia sp.]|uniref:hypothetical protein n=1 Tax=Ottowia sp. TaxID=1898956 RepID=UPI0025E47032|nr:hypothetical protein [Ottowia sp.]MBK6616083.1 hypothetical protein [Ottowia sp.]